MATIVDRDDTVRLLSTAFDAVTQLGASIEGDQWDEPLCLPGWTVKDALSHLIGTEEMLEGEPVPDVDVSHHAHLRNELAQTVEQWVESMRSTSGPELVDRWRNIVERRKATLGGMDQAAFDEPSWTPAGPDETFGRFMRIRHFDAFMHENDMRDALGLDLNDEPEHVRFSLTEPVSGLGFVVGKRAGIPDGNRVRLELTGSVEETLLIEVDGRANVVDELSGEPTVGLRMPTSLYLRLAGGRQDPEPHLDGTAAEQIELSGDETLARQLATNLAFTI